MPEYVRQIGPDGKPVPVKATDAMLDKIGKLVKENARLRALLLEKQIRDDR